MTTATTDTQALRYFEGVAEVRADAADTIPVVELAMPKGTMPPLHAHGEDEAIVVVAGRLTFFVGDDVLDVSAGDSFVAPRRVPHTYRVESDEGARWLTITPGGCYERFVRAVSRPAGEVGLPPAPGPMTLEQAVAFTAAAAEHGIEILGPPGALPGV